MAPITLAIEVASGDSHSCHVVVGDGAGYAFAYLVPA